MKRPVLIPHLRGPGRTRSGRTRVTVSAGPTMPRRRLRLSRPRLGTRGSPLAMWQARHVAGRLARVGLDVEIARISTVGDRDRRRAICDLPSRAPFSDEIEQAVLRGQIDLAVHSLKDLPLAPTPGLSLVAILRRGDVREVLVSHRTVRLADLSAGAVVGTSSPRRAAQICHSRPDLETAPIRGPVDDRVKQIRAGRFDAAILAAAGLQRLGLGDEISEVLSLDAFLPAPGQAALAVQVRDDDPLAEVIRAALDDEPTRRATEAELMFSRAVGDRDDWAVAAHAVASEGAPLGHRRLAGRLAGESTMWHRRLAGGVTHVVDVTPLPATPRCGGIILRVRILSLDGTMVREAEVTGDGPEAAASMALERIGLAHGAVAERVR